MFNSNTYPFILKIKDLGYEPIGRMYNPLFTMIPGKTCTQFNLSPTGGPGTLSYFKADINWVCFQKSS